jgi:WD40 repeat protein
VSGSADKTMRIWDIETGKQHYIINHHLAAVNTLAITPDNKTIITGCANGKIQLWNLSSGELYSTLENYSTAISCIAIHPDGKIIASSSQDGIIKLWNIETGELVESISGFSPLTFSTDGKILISGGKAGTIKIWRQVHKDDNLPLIGEWWEILGVEANAIRRDVKVAYLRLARLYHPDINTSTNAKAAMQAVNQAYQKFQNQENLREKN